MDLKPQTDDFTHSINFINDKLTELREAFDTSNSKARKKELEGEIEVWKQRLEVAKEGAEKEKNIYETIPAELDDLNNQSLRKYKKYWQDQLQIGKAAKDELAQNEALLKLNAADQILSERTAENLQKISGSLNEASNMFREFGDDVMAGVFEKLSGLAGSIGMIISGISSGNILGVVSGAIGGLTALFSGIGGTPEKTKYQQAIGGITSALKVLNAQLESAYGKEALDILDAQMKHYMSLMAQSHGLIVMMRSNIEEFGSTPELEKKLDEQILAYEQAANDLKRAKDQYQEILTGTTGQAITDSIIQGFENGKKGAEDFAQTFEDVMKDALLNTFKQNWLLDQVDGFMTLFTKLSEDGLTSDDINALREMWNKIVDQGTEAMEGMEAILGEAGLDPFGATPGSKPQGLSGAIAGITEDTANELAGYMNAVRLDIKQGLRVNEQSLQHLGEIAANTRYNRYPENMDRNMTSMDGRMATIEKGILDFQARG